MSVSDHSTHCAEMCFRISISDFESEQLNSKTQTICSRQLSLALQHLKIKHLALSGQYRPPSLITWPICLVNSNTLSSSKKQFQIAELPGLSVDCTQSLNSLTGELKQKAACSGGYAESQTTVLELKNISQPAQTLLQIAASLTKIRQQIHFNKAYKVLETVVLFCAKA